MLFETSEISKAIKEKTFDTPGKAFEIINSGKENIHIKNDNEQTYYHLLAYSYESDDDAPTLIPVVYQLSIAGLDINSADKDGNTALHVAARTPNSRLLIRAFLLVGAEVGLGNVKEQTAPKLAKTYPQNAKVFKQFGPDLWNSVLEGAVDHVEKLTNNWCKINQQKDGKSISELASEGGNMLIKKCLMNNETTNEFIHFCLAGDRQKMRPYFKKPGTNIDATTSLFIDKTSGECVGLSILGETALLGINSVVRKLLRKNANFNYKIGGKSLFLYVLENIAPHKCFYETIDILAKKIDFTKYKEETHAILDAAYKKRVPIDVLRTMTASGLDLFAADDDGHFLRDRILMKCYKEVPHKLAKELAYPDNILIDMAKNGCMDVINSLLNRNYDYLDVTTDDAGSVRTGLTKFIGNSKAESFFSEASTNQHLFREIVRVTEAGHLEQVQKLLTPKVLKMTDRIGRTLTHKAVLFERRHVLRHLIKIDSKVHCNKDNFGRTPLFYACLSEDAEDIITSLKMLGCKMDDVDVNGDSPNTMMDMSSKEKEMKLVCERKKDPGIDTYLFFKYLEIKEAVREGSLERVEEIRSMIYKDILMNDMMKKMYQTDPPQRCILQFAVDAKRDTIAKYLLTLGMNWDVTYKDGNEEITLYEAADRRNMGSLADYIRFQMEKHEKYRELLKKLKNKGVVKNTKNIKTVGNTDNSPSVDYVDVDDSKSCVIQ
ncbi:hypothetical protein ACF0H5_003386 [Mactra antiquata]